MGLDLRPDRRSRFRDDLRRRRHGRRRCRQRVGTEQRGHGDDRERRDREGTYQLENVNSGLALGVSEAGTSNGDNVVQWEWNGGDNQRWTIEETSTGVYRLTNVNSGKVLNIYDNGTSDGDDVVQWADTGGNNQR